MAKVTAPLFSASASGNLKKTIVFSKSKNINTVKGNRLEKTSQYYFTTKKYTSQTRDQLGVREYFNNAVEAWNDLNESEKQVYKDEAKQLKNTPVGVFVKAFMLSNYASVVYEKAWLFGIGHGIILQMFEHDFNTGLLLSVHMES